MIDSITSWSLPRVSELLQTDGSADALQESSGPPGLTSDLLTKKMFETREGG